MHLLFLFLSAVSTGSILWAQQACFYLLSVFALVRRFVSLIIFLENIVMSYDFSIITRCADL